MGWAGLPENKGRPSPFGGCGLLRFPAALWAQRQTAGTAGLNALPGSQGGSGSASVGVCLWFGAPSFMTRAVFTVFSHRQNFLFFSFPNFSLRRPMLRRLTTAFDPLQWRERG